VDSDHKLLAVLTVAAASAIVGAAWAAAWHSVSETRACVAAGLVPQRVANGITIWVKPGTPQPAEKP
jgi:hypothetical protein